MENLYILKVMEQFLNKGWRLGTEQTFKKAARNWQDEAAALEAYRIFLDFLLRNIHA